jgi:hypothetical protein
MVSCGLNAEKIVSTTQSHVGIILLKVAFFGRIECCVRISQAWLQVRQLCRSAYIVDYGITIGLIGADDLQQSHVSNTC